MVRLKDEYVAAEIVYSLFQFQYGTIKSECERPALLRDWYFNSSMVRLKDSHIMLYISLARFQFQYGTIKSASGITPSQGAYISIPVWYD